MYQFEDYLLVTPRPMKPLAPKTVTTSPEKEDLIKIPQLKIMMQVNLKQACSVGNEDDNNRWSKPSTPAAFHGSCIHCPWTADLKKFCVTMAL